MGLLDRLSGLLGSGDTPDPEELFAGPDDDGGREGAASDGAAGGDTGDAAAAGDPMAGVDAEATDDSTGGGGDGAAPAADIGGAAESTGPAAAAREFADEWREADLDFTPASLGRLDDLVDHQWDLERFRDAELGGDAMDDAVFTGLVHRLGSYYGEVLVRHLEGEWVEHDQLGTAVAVDGEGETAAVSNAYHIAADCLTEPSKFALSFDTVADQVGRDHERVSEGGQVVTTEADAPDDEGGEADGGGGDGSEEPEEPLDSEEVAARFDEDAADLVDAFPGYDLDYSPASLERLDRLVAEEFAGHDFSGVPLGREDDGDSLFLTARAMEGGGYLAAVLRRAVGGHWRDDEDGLSFAVEGEAGMARLDPVAVAADVYRGEDSFASTYDALVGRLSLDGEGAAADEADAADQEEADDDPPRDPAASFAAEYPAYDLDFSPASLAQVDALAADLSGAPTDVARGMAAYVGETFVRAHGAEWTREDGAWVVEVGGDADEPKVVALRPLVEDAVAGEAAVAAVHDHVADRLGLEGAAAGEEGDGTAGEGDAAATEERSGDDGDGDAVIDRFAARAAVEAAAEDERAAASDEAVERHRETAEDLVAEWPDYDLDFSAESLVRLDALVAASFDRSGGDRDYDGDPLSVPEGAQLSIPTDGSVASFGGYLAELFRRHHDAAWRADGDDLVLVVDGPTGTAAFDPQLVAVACFAGESSFVDAYARVAADAGLEPPL